MLPLARHIRLARTLDLMMREGYVGRQPRTAEHVKVLEKLYHNQQAGKLFAASTDSTPQLSTSLIGLSGVGKTTTVKRVLAMTPQVIHHPELHIWQIPYLHIEAPHDGASIKGLMHSILRKVDKLIPDANYYEQYALKGKPSVETLVNHAARILHIHFAGLLVVDETQNLENAPKNKQSLMTLLVSASNELGVPILFIGTNKARRVLGLDFRQARRSVGQGLAYWAGLEKSENSSDASEWSDFLETLWQYQWVQKPAQMNSHIMDLMFFHTQGIPDLAIKLFAAAQWRAMLDGSETITAALLDDVANKEMKLIQPMVQALRDGNLEALQAYDDIAPLNFENLLRDVQLQYEGKRVKGASIRPGHQMFSPALAESLTALGVEAEHAAELADKVEMEDKPVNLLDGVKKAVAHLDTPKVTARKGLKQKTRPEFPPDDLRNATWNARETGTTVFEQLHAMRAVCDLSSVLQLG